MPWSDWEDHAAGLYSPAAFTGGDVAASVALLSDTDRFYETGREMLREWPNAARHNLAHMWSGRNAWLGQAACLYAHGATSAATREAWGRMSNPVQAAANSVARQLRDEWEREADGAQTLFAD